MLSFACKSILRITAYNAVQNARTNPSNVESLVKQFADRRKTSMMIFIGLIAVYADNGRVMAASWAVALILLTRNISSMYDALDIEAFNAHINAIGPVAFTLVNMTPGFAVTAMLSAELITKSGCAILGVLQVILALSPAFLPAIGEALSLFWRQPAPANLPSAGGLPSPG